MRRSSRSVLILITIGCTSLISQTPSFRDVVTGLRVPWEICWGPDSWIWVTERNGRISRIHPETGEQRILTTISSVYEAGESGLLGLALHPNFADSPYVFVAYTHLQGSRIIERIVRYTYNGSSLSEPLILLDGIPGNTIHDGCRLVILPDRTMLITTGDAAVPSLSQDTTSLAGKVLRINLDGSVPYDNPYPRNPLWSRGLRNSQGLCYYDGIVYSSEHGPQNDDEVNIIESGRNYGWPAVNGFCDLPSEQEFCSTHNVMEPLAAWTPTIAPCGMDYYASDRKPEWEHSLLMTTLKDARLWLLKLDSTRRRIVRQTIIIDRQLGRLRDVCVSPDGRVFVATSNRDGRGTPRQGDDRIVELLTVSSTETQRTFAWWLSPLPLGSQAILHMHISQPQTIQLEFLSLNGCVVRRWIWENLHQGLHLLAIDTSSLATGIYLATLMTPQHIERVIVPVYP